MRTQHAGTFYEPGYSPHQTPTLPAPGSWPSELPQQWKMNFCYLINYPGYGIFVTEAQTAWDSHLSKCKAYHTTSFLKFLSSQLLMPWSFLTSFWNNFAPSLLLPWKSSLHPTSPSPLGCHAPRSLLYCPGGFSGSVMYWIPTMWRWRTRTQPQRQCSKPPRSLQPPKETEARVNCGGGGRQSRTISLESNIWLYLHFVSFQKRKLI
jgi:hypothetical protein